MSRTKQRLGIAEFWDIHGRIYIDYQRAAQITWWSILQGISVTFLVAEILALPGYIQHGGNICVFFLYFGASFVNIVNAWVQMSWAVLTTKWEIEVVHACLTLFAGLTLALTMTQVTYPQLWFLGMLFVIDSTIAIHLYNLLRKLTVDSVQTQETVRKLEIVCLILAYLIYSVFAAAAVQFIQSEHEFVFGLLALIFCISGLAIQAFRMARHRVHLRNQEVAQAKREQWEGRITEMVAQAERERWERRIIEMVAQVLREQEARRIEERRITEMAVQTKREQEERRITEMVAQAERERWERIITEIAAQAKREQEERILTEMVAQVLRKRWERIIAEMAAQNHPENAE